MDLNEMLVFARVVRAGSFTTAAAELRMPKSTVSRKVSELEERLGSRLLQRTTRKLGLTDVGRTYYEYCARIAGDVEDAERAVTNLQGVPRGLLRVTAGINAKYLAPIVSDYLRRYPEVRLELYCTGRTVDLVEEGFDLGIRAGALVDSTLIAKSVGRVSWFLVATPAYLKKKGRPKSPEDLKDHDCLFFGVGSTTFALRLERQETPVQVDVPARLLVSDFDVLYAVTSAGLGIGLLPAYLCVDDLRAHKLVQLLGDWNAPSIPIHAVYPSTRHVSPKVKTFVEHFQAHLTPPPWELGPVPDR
jgi:DNA-binding transcriptional LysR family regulator